MPLLSANRGVMSTKRLQRCDVSTAAGYLGDNFWLGMRVAALGGRSQGSVQSCAVSEAARICTEPRTPACSLQTRCPAKNCHCATTPAPVCVLSKGCAYPGYCDVLQRCRYARWAATLTQVQRTSAERATHSTSSAARHIDAYRGTCAILDGCVQRLVNIITVIRPWQESLRIPRLLCAQRGVLTPAQWLPRMWSTS